MCFVVCTLCWCAWSEVEVKVKPSFEKSLQKLAKKLHKTHSKAF